MVLGTSKEPSERPPPRIKEPSDHPPLMVMLGVHLVNTYLYIYPKLYLIPQLIFTSNITCLFNVHWLFAFFNSVHSIRHSGRQISVSGDDNVSVACSSPLSPRPAVYSRRAFPLRLQRARQSTSYVPS